MLQRLAQFCIALLDFLEQPNIFDGDDRLISESFDQLDLTFRERFNDVAPYNDAANWRSFSQQRCS